MANQHVSAVVMAPFPLPSPCKLMGYIKLEAFLNNQTKRKKNNKGGPCQEKHKPARNIWHLLDSN